MCTELPEPLQRESPDLEPKSPSDVQKTCTRRRDAYGDRMGRDSRVYVKASPEEQQVFCSVADALGQGENMSAAIRFVMFEKARELGVLRPAAGKAKSVKRVSA